MEKIITLVYTGINRFIIKSIPPRTGAIMPLYYKNIVQAITVDSIQCQCATCIRDSDGADAIPQAVPQTKKGEKVMSITQRFKENVYTLFVPNISGVLPYNTAQIV